MAEAVGLALGAVALVVPTYKGYKTVADLINEISHHDKSLHVSNNTFRVQQALFKSELAHIIRRVVGEENAQEMLADLDHPQWSNKDFEEDLEASLEPAVKAALKLTWDSLNEIKASLKNAQEFLNSGEYTMTGAASPGQAKTRPSYRKRIKSLGTRVEWAVSGKAVVTKSLGVLRKQTQDLRSLREEQTRLEAPEAGPRGSKKRLSERQVSWGKDGGLEILAAREIAERLYEGLKETATCQCHRVNLRLGISKAMGAAGVRADFRLVITPERADTGPSILQGHRCFCLSVTSEEQPDDAKFEPTPNSLGSSSPVNSTVAQKSSVQKNIISNRRTMLALAKTTTSSKTSSRVTFAGDNTAIELANPENSRTNQLQDKGKQKAAVTSTSSSISTATVTIKQLCAVLKPPDQHSTTATDALYLGNLEDSTRRQYRHSVYQEPITFPLSYKISLSQVLTRDDKPQLLPRRERIRIAFILSTAILQYGSFSAPWFQERWRSEDVYFFVDRQKRLQDAASTDMDPHVAGFFKDMTTLEAEDVSSTTRISPAKNDQLFSLAVVLTEIAFGEVLANIQERKSITGSSDDIMWEFLKMREISKSRMLAHEIGRKYAGVVERCLDCDFGLGKGDLHTREVQEAFYRNVVKVLEDCVQSFDEE